MHGAARVTSGGGRPIYVAGAFLVAAVIAFQWFQSSPRVRSVARAQPDQTPELEVRVEPATPAPAEVRPALAGRVTPAAAVASVQAVAPPAEVELTAEERRRKRQGRFDHIQDIFRTQSAKDFDPVRAQKLERALAPTLAEAARAGGTLEVGFLECRGRMCGVDLSFDEPTEVPALKAAVTQAVLTLHEGAPLVHLVTHAGDTGKKNVGRLFFEWLAPSPNPSPNPANEP